MAITVGGGKGSFSDPNIVPLIDILLVLIIIFMAIQPTVPKGHQAEVPQPTPNIRIPTEPAPETIVVQVLSGGALKINDEPQTWDTLGLRLADIFKRRAEKVAFVRGDDQVLFREIARAIDLMRSSGVDRVGLLTAKFSLSH